VFRIVNFTLLIRVVAIVTTMLSLVLYQLIQIYGTLPLQSVQLLTLAPWIALALTLLITSKWTSRLIWRVAKGFNNSLYPDLNGTWEGEIQTESGETLAARAVIRQSLLHTEIDMHTETAKSVTLEATPVMEGGQYKLYYSYRAKPKKPGFGAYTGSTVFDVRLEGTADTVRLELSGYYFTDRKTLGSTRLLQVGHDPNKDVSFY
jgi:hypothetical protein